jgi:transcriptional regulator with XRE-family HTH domain
MSYSVNAARLRYEMARRGWDAINLAREARLSPATVSTALAGKPVSAQSLSLIVEALSRTPANDLIDRLIDQPGDFGYA